MKIDVLVILAAVGLSLLMLNGCVGAGGIAQRDPPDPAVQKGDVRPVSLPTTARLTGAG